MITAAEPARSDHAVPDGWQRVLAGGRGETRLRQGAA